jgi:DNA-binding CsgD family transcriptional regulator
MDDGAAAAKPSYADIADLLAILFSSLTDEEPWSAFLDGLARSADVSFVTFILTPRGAERPGLFLTPKGDPDVGVLYTSSLFATDPFTGLPDGKVVRFRDFVPAASQRRNAAYFQFLAETTGDEVLGLEIREPGGLELRLRLTRSRAQQPFTEQDEARFEAIVPHLRIALRLFDRLATGETEQQIYAGAIEQMAVGMILLDKRGKVIRLNPTAATILAEEDGIALRGTSIAIDDAELARSFQARIAGAEEDMPLTIRIPRTSGRGDLLLVTGSAHAPDYVTAGGGPATVLYLSDPVHAPRVSPESIRELLGLTQSESAIAADIASGLSLTDSATHLGVSPNTVRAHLRSIFHKTGVKRQSQLVHLVHHSLPGLTRPTV